MSTDRLQDIRQRAASNPDIAHLLTLLDEKSRRIGELEKINKTLTAQAIELSQELENVKADFGGDQR